MPCTVIQAWNRINDLVEKVAELERTNCKIQSRYERQLEVIARVNYSKAANWQI